MTERNFSQRHGYEPIKEIQFEAMDDELKNRLWNVSSDFYLPREDSRYLFADQSYVLLWRNFFKFKINDLSNYDSTCYSLILELYEKLSWNKVYDFIEFLANNCPTRPSSKDAQSFMKECNIILEEEVSGYRFVSKLIVPLTSKVEITEIEEVINSPLNTVKDHFSAALKLFSDKPNPDYRNSIKESISAVESICQIITGNSKATLGDALDAIDKQKKITLPASLRLAFDKLYGYASSSDGIRHALSGESNIKHEDARFMLVSCSAFVNYLISKAQEAGIL